LHSTEDDTLAH